MKRPGPGADTGEALAVLEREIVACRRCPRLRAWCEHVAQVKKRAYRDEQYWGRPVPGFGDPAAAVYILGLAPAAHGANRTGRMFTGDRSGDWLYRALWETGFASQAESVRPGDGLALRRAWIGACVRCAPPANRPLAEEIRTCREYVERELALLRHVRVVVALGRVAHENYLAVRGLRRSSFPFGHGAVHRLEGVTLIDSYHPSQQNTLTGRLTRAMLRQVFERARRLIG